MLKRLNLSLLTAILLASTAIVTPAAWASPGSVSVALLPLAKKALIKVANQSKKGLTKVKGTFFERIKKDKEVMDVYAKMIKEASNGELSASTGAVSTLRNEKKFNLKDIPSPSKKTKKVEAAVDEVDFDAEESKLLAAFIQRSIEKDAEANKLIKELEEKGPNIDFLFDVKAVNNDIEVVLPDKNILTLLSSALKETEISGKITGDNIELYYTSLKSTVLKGFKNPNSKEYREAEKAIDREINNLRKNNCLLGCNA